MRKVLSKNFCSAAFNKSQFDIPDSDQRWRQSVKFWLPKMVLHVLSVTMELIYKSYQDAYKFQNWSDCRMTSTNGNYFGVYLLSRACSWMVMATEMAEVSNRVNFGSKPRHLTCLEKSRQHADPMILGQVRKKVQNSVSGKYRTCLHLSHIAVNYRYKWIWLIRLIIYIFQYRYIKFLASRYTIMC